MAKTVRDTPRRKGRPKQSEQTELTADRILSVATQLFIEHGYESVSTETVAAACGVTKAMVYYYFQSKANLFLAAMQTMMENVRVRTEQLLASDISLYDRLLTIATARLRIHTPLSLEVIMRGSEKALTDTQFRAMKEAEERLIETIASALTRAIDRGEIASCDVRLSARAYLAMVNVAKESLSTREGSLEENAKRALDLFWHGIGPPASPSPMAKDSSP
ncbi:TetR/AcrR family transcriptional regulator [Ferroacidibacillus organovorans]|uniref:HTH tetR-type domain-containing protein n=1 Tax=Ferroacidibacillus organovorans TaxID=1765683 RepID=A0A101XNM2_9BACL|nr:TetR/AcrR family transcriptional regulator [Ferroacidibacillus organovorans]KUO94586.1 hypothetical protein ATW55_04110 [Ferroacidibacillus organovorans]